MLRLLSLVCMVTRAPASRHTLAAACSTPLLRSTPARAQAAQWSPSGSRLRRDRQARSVKGNGSRRQRSRRMRKMWSGYVVPVVYGIVVKALLAKVPFRNRARLGWLHRCCCIPLPWLFCGKGLTRVVASLVGLAL